MHKIWLIIKREYLTRVRKKTFIISTLLFPLLYLALIFGMGYLAEKSRQNLRIAIIDSSGYFTEQALNRQNTIDNSSTLVLVKDSTDKVITDHKEAGYDGYIVIPAINWQSAKTEPLLFKANKSYGSSSTSVVEAKMNRLWDEVKNEGLGIDAEKRRILAESRITVSSRNIKDEKANAKTAEGIAFTCGILIYMILLIYGSQVMMGVMEEKTNRIAEVIVSSVKPFQMMLGKILGHWVGGTHTVFFMDRLLYLLFITSVRHPEAVVWQMRW
ncbi:MAG: ABC transporter permease [Chitinophagaceae bacterium]